MEETLDPRILRTRQVLQQSLAKLIKDKGLDKISVQEIADTAKVNRATFYDHYSDKYSLLKCAVAARFDELLAERQVGFSHCCGSSLKGVLLAVCDYVAQLVGPDGQRTPEPHMESAIISVIGNMLLEGVREHATGDGVPAEMRSAAAGWAIYGAAKEWAQTPARPSSEAVVESMFLLVAPILRLPVATPTD